MYKHIITRLCLVMVAVGLLLLPPLLNAEVRSRQEPGISFYCLSTDTKPVTSHQGRTTIIGDRLFEIDTGIESVFNGVKFVVSSAATVEAPTNSISWTKPDTTVAMSVSGFNIAAYLFNLQNIDTNVSMILQAKAGASVWTAIEGDSTTYTTDGGKVLKSDNVALYDSTRLVWWTELGGTAATIENIYASKARE